MAPPGSNFNELKTGVWRWLIPRIVIGVVLVVLAAIFIFWPR